MEYCSIAIGLSLCLSVSLSVCLFASISLELLDRSSQNFVCGSPVAATRSFYVSVAIRHVFLVLWMMSCLAVVGQVGRPTSTSGVVTLGWSLMSKTALLFKLLIYIVHDIPGWEVLLAFHWRRLSRRRGGHSTGFSGAVVWRHLSVSVWHRVFLLQRFAHLISWCPTLDSLWCLYIFIGMSLCSINCV